MTTLHAEPGRGRCRPATRSGWNVAAVVTQRERSRFRRDRPREFAAMCPCAGKAARLEEADFATVRSLQAVVWQTMSGGNRTSMKAAWDRIRRLKSPLMPTRRAVRIDVGVLVPDGWLRSLERPASRTLKQAVQLRLPSRSCLAGLTGLASVNRPLPAALASRVVTSRRRRDCGSRSWPSPGPRSERGLGPRAA